MVDMYWKANVGLSGKEQCGRREFSVRRCLYGGIYIRMKRYTMKYYVELLKKEGLLENIVSNGAEKEEICRISCHSGTVSRGTLFICKGAAFRGSYLKEAAEKGALAYVSEKEFPEGKGMAALLVKDIRRAMAVLAEAFYENPAKKLRIIGVTGTKGKTTTAYYIRAVLDEWLSKQGQKPSAILSSIETYDGVEYRPAVLTTPEPLELQKYLRTAVDAGISFLTMEVSSQAMKLHRIGNTKMETGVFLNISNDHISPAEHKDFEDYFFFQAENAFALQKALH